MSWQSNVRKTHHRYCGHATCSDRKWCDCPSATVLASGPLHRWNTLVWRTKVSQTTFKENTSICENFIFSIPEGAWFWGELSNRLSPSSLHPANHTCSWFLGRDKKIKRNLTETYLFKTFSAKGWEIECLYQLQGKQWDVLWFIAYQVNGCVKDKKSRCSVVHFQIQIKTLLKLLTHLSKPVHNLQGSEQSKHQ
jgi:hypothetical protein